MRGSASTAETLPMAAEAVKAKARERLSVPLERNIVVCSYLSVVINGWLRELLDLDRLFFYLIYAVFQQRPHLQGRVIHDR
mmetsp:Transcript_30132/g.60539  ORF Transcript_30132/g.60539 Transcript_30132/m.60539 type:complete len:81 (-) Transcript_30132:85-327(-)